MAHTEIDLANPKGNVKNSGFTPEEREDFSSWLASGFTDSFRHFHPDKSGAYTFWSYMGNARGRNVGWRIDYFVVSDRFVKDVAASEIRELVLGSDHCPVMLLVADSKPIESGSNNELAVADSKPIESGSNNEPVVENGQVDNEHEVKSDRVSHSDDQNETNDQNDGNDDVDAASDADQCEGHVIKINGNVNPIITASEVAQ